MAQCEAETSKGQPCGREPLPGGGFCVHHEPSITAEEQAVLARVRRAAGVLTSKQRKSHSRALRHRADHLSRILDNWRGDPRGKPWAQQEFAAIEWVLGVLERIDGEED